MACEELVLRKMGQLSVPLLLEMLAIADKPPDSSGGLFFYSDLISDKGQAFVIT
jgi:hypothetical protein